MPEIVDSPPENLLELTFRTVRTFPGMTVTADVTRTNPLMSWPNDPDAYYTLILANLDINNRRNRYKLCSCMFLLIEHRLKSKYYFYP